MNYEDILAKAPPADTPAFLDYLREHNPVVFDNPQWLVIRNIKYDSPEREWLTAFLKNRGLDWYEKAEWYDDVDILWFHFGPEYNFLIKSSKKQTVPNRFHMHMYKDEV